jgi:hypothetical protein
LIQTVLLGLSDWVGPLGIILQHHLLLVKIFANQILKKKGDIKKRIEKKKISLMAASHLKPFQNGTQIKEEKNLKFGVQHF